MSYPSHGYTAVVIDGGHKRESPSHIRLDPSSPRSGLQAHIPTPSHQLRRGNTQCALIATIQKLYTMVRNNVSWELADPEMNEKEQRAIHDRFQARTFSRRGLCKIIGLSCNLHSQNFHSHCSESRKTSADSSNYSSTLDSTDRASSKGSDHSNYDPIWAQQRRVAAKTNPHALNTTILKPTPSILARPSMDKNPVCPTRNSSETSRSIPSPIRTDFQIQSVIF